MLPPASVSPIRQRLNRLVGIEGADDGLGVGGDLVPRLSPRLMPAGAELMSARQGLAGIWALHGGWGAHVELLADRRRQLVHLVLPGEIIAYPRPGRALSSTTVIALTSVQLCIWSIADAPALAAAQYAALGASDEVEHRCMTNQIARIGRRSAYERVAHLLLEIRDRLGLAGVSENDRFPLPLTQEMLADVLGLTSVHINRTLQQLRQQRHIDCNSGMITLRDPDQLVQIADYRPLLVEHSKPR